MSTVTDNFEQVLYNDGEELVFSDLNNGQHFLSAKLTDQIFAKLIPMIQGAVAAGDPQFQGEYGTSIGAFALATTGPRAFALSPGGAYPWVGSQFLASRTLAANVVGIAPGTLFQLVGDDSAGTDTNLIPFTFAGTESFTIAAGDPSHPRVDLLQMSLSYVNASSTSRVFAQNAQKSYLDFSLHTTHVNTVVEAKVPGVYGNNISIALTKRLTGSGVSITESGFAVTILYQDGISTVADLEAAITGTSNLLEVKTSGTAGNVLHDPADTMVATVLISGSDEILVTQSMNKNRQVQCVLSVKSGTPAASPVYPTPDSGACVIGAVIVGTSYSTATQILAGIDTAGANAVLHDQRIPLGIRVYRVQAKDMMADPSSQWALSSSQQVQVPVAGSEILRAVCPIGGTAGRVMAVGIQASFDTGALTKLRRRGMGGVDEDYLADLSADLVLNDRTTHFFLAPINEIELRAVFAAGPTVVHDTTSKLGAPVWTSGERVPTRPFEAGISGTDRCLELEITSSGTGLDTVWAVYWYVAEGL